MLQTESDPNGANGRGRALARSRQCVCAMLVTNRACVGRRVGQSGEHSPFSIHASDPRSLRSTHSALAILSSPFLLVPSAHTHIYCPLFSALLCSALLTEGVKSHTQGIEIEARERHVELRVRGRHRRFCARDHVRVCASHHSRRGLAYTAFTALGELKKRLADDAPRCTDVGHLPLLLC